MDIGTTDPAVMVTVLDALRSSGLRWALLHGSERIESGQASSDADVVIDEPDERKILASLQRGLADSGLLPIMVWPYDTGTMSVFVVRSDTPGGAQLDVTFDRCGGSVYGLRSPEIVADRSVDGRWPTVAAIDGAVYELMKGLRKQDPRRVQQARSVGDRAVLERARLVLGPTALGFVERLIDQGVIGTPSPRVTVSRAIRRLRSPVGAWIHATDGSVGDLAGQFVGVVPRVVAGVRDPGLVDAVRSRIEVVRPTLVFTVGAEPPLAADVAVRGPEPYSSVVLALSRRVHRRFHLPV